MKKLLSITILILLLTSCKTKTVYVPVKQTSVEVVTLRDTVVETRLQYYRDTISTPDTISFLSNPYGFSWAETKEGKLNHSLTVWPDSFIPVRIQYIDRLRIDSIPAPYPVEVLKPVEKELNIWQKLRIRIGEVALIFILLSIAYLIFKKKKF